MKTYTKREGKKGYSINASDVPAAINKLGKIEHESYDLISKICDDYCKYQEMYGKKCRRQFMLDAQCFRCPLDKLANLILQDDSKEPKPI